MTDDVHSIDADDDVVGDVASLPVDLQAETWPMSREISVANTYHKQTTITWTITTATTQQVC